MTDPSHQTSGISSSPTGSISWTDITPDPMSNKNWAALAINSDNSLMAASDGEFLYTSVGLGIGWSQQGGVGTGSVAISTTSVHGAGPGIYPPGLPTGPGTNWKSITAASAIDPKTGANYSAILTAAAQTYHLDPDAFARQIFQESSFNAKAIGPPIPGGAAMGLGQFTPATAKTYGINPFDPTQALNTAANYMSSLRHDNYGNYGFALVVYVGAGSVLAEYLAGNTGVMPQAALDYVLNITGRTLAEWAAKGFALIAANKATSNIAVSRDSASSWVDQLPQPGALPMASVAIAGNGADAVAGAASALWFTRSL
jgi:hypothetical protein